VRILRGRKRIFSNWLVEECDIEGTNSSTGSRDEAILFMKLCFYPM